MQSLSSPHQSGGKAVVNRSGEKSIPNALCSLNERISVQVRPLLPPINFVSSSLQPPPVSGWLWLVSWGQGLGGEWRRQTALGLGRDFLTLLCWCGQLELFLKLLGHPVFSFAKSGCSRGLVTSLSGAVTAGSRARGSSDPPALLHSARDQPQSSGAGETPSA